MDINISLRSLSIFTAAILKSLFCASAVFSFSGSLLYGCWDLVETYYPGYYCVCVYAGVEASAFKMIVILYLYIWTFSLSDRCSVPWFWVPSVDHRRVC